MSAPVKSHEAFGLNSPEQQLLWWDDFLGDALDDRWASAGSAGGSAVVVDAQTGGIARLTTDGDTNDNWMIDWGDIRTLLTSKKVTLETRVKVSDITNIQALIRLRDDNNDQIYFRYDTTLGANWRIVADSGGQTIQDSGIAADTDYHIFRIETTSTAVSYFIDDVEVSNSPITTNITAVPIQPNFFISTRENAAKTMDIDYVVIRQER